MNRVNITRTARKDGYTIGKLSVNGNYVCDTLEPRDKTFFGEDFTLGSSAIPVGVYELATEVYSPKFEDYRPRVRGFKYSNNILVHEGNKPKDTEGCILVGICPTRVKSEKRKVNSESNCEPDYDAGWIGQSKATLKKLQQKLSEQSSWTLIVN